LGLVRSLVDEEEQLALLDFRPFLDGAFIEERFVEVAVTRARTLMLYSASVRP